MQRDQQQNLSWGHDEIIQIIPNHMLLKIDLVHGSVHQVE